MAHFSFNRFNKERVFDFDTQKISGEYTNLEGLFKRDGEGVVYQVKGVYVSTKSEFADESPIVALEDTYVNLPQHQLADIKDMLEDKNAIKAINDGYAGFTIRQYTKNLKGKNGKMKPKDCYSAEWCDYVPDDSSDDEDMM